ncbi:nuclear cap-binding protein subunit 3 [Plakobranchus ocellatus]|uniref:Nuclear cap-binding protein subunit 3 n=1 Tax=Plakobranchus ocellatus TaxID=259542 RepID=A0AAV4DVI4_9GAST|nr:nuclear cap-binding protein subunit 3 [Plakobranchus ocellatus]
MAARGRLPNLKICVDNTESTDESSDESVQESESYSSEDQYDQKSKGSKKNPKLEEGEAPEDVLSIGETEPTVRKFLSRGAVPGRGHGNFKPKVYENKSGNFVTGVDVTSEEAQELRDKRAQRFGTLSTPKHPITDVDIKNLYKRGWEDSSTVPAPGPSSPVAGPSSSVAGPSSPVDGPSSPVAGSSSSLAGFYPAAPGPSSSVAGFSLSVSGASSSVAGPSSFVAGPSSFEAGPSSSVAGPSSLITTGPSLPVAGLSSQFLTRVLPLSRPSSPISEPPSPLVQPTRSQKKIALMSPEEEPPFQQHCERTIIDVSQVGNLVSQLSCSSCASQTLEEEGCDKNFDGTSGMMEVKVAEILRLRSIERHKLRYVTLVSDGDSKAYNRICEVAPYGEAQIEKEECLNHVGKRLGTALRNLVSDCLKRKITLGWERQGHTHSKGYS